MTFHRCPLHRCHTTRASVAYPPVPNLLAPVASRGLMQGTAHAIAIAHSRGIPFRVAEMGPVTCGGTWGVSNSSASALWVLDALFAIAGSGADGVNIQRRRGREHRTRSSTSIGWAGSGRAGASRVYGALMFAQAAPGVSRLLGLGYAGGSHIRVWATLTPGDQIHLVAINASLRQST